MKISTSNYGRCLYYVSNVVAREMERMAITAWKPVGLPPSHAYLLMLVVATPGIQPSSLSEQLKLKPSTITRLMEKLEERKLIVRTTTGKITNVYPTPKGKDLLPKMKDCAASFEENCISILGKIESARFVQQMSKVADKLGT